MNQSKKKNIKKQTRLIAGAALAIIMLVVPVTTAVKGGHWHHQAQASLAQSGSSDDEPHIRNEFDDNFLIFDGDTIDRHLNDIAGLDTDPQASTPVDAIGEDESTALWDQAYVERVLGQSYSDADDTATQAITKREAVDAIKRDKDLLIEKEAQAKKEAAKKEAAKKAEIAKKEAAKKAKAETVIQQQALPTGNDRFLIQVNNPDTNYTGRPFQVSDRNVLEGLVMGEFGNDYLGAVLVAQCIRDSMIKEGTNSTSVIKRKYGYTAPVRRSVTQDVKRAVAFVFDEGGSGVQHPIYYFYASNLVKGKWHETQNFVVQRHAVRFFSPHR